MLEKDKMSFQEYEEDKCDFLLQMSKMQRQLFKKELKAMLTAMKLIPMDINLTKLDKHLQHKFI